MKLCCIARGVTVSLLALPGLVCGLGARPVGDWEVHGLVRQPWFRRLIVNALAAPRMKARIWKHWYRYFDRRVESRGLRFMNYGLHLPEAERPPLDPQDEDDRGSIQLYHQVLSAVDLRNARVLEVSSGRGGGADYLSRYFQTKEIVALDRTESALQFSIRSRRGQGLRFLCGDALALPLRDESFDAVVNVEASHCYPDLAGFLSEVRRVLRPGGHFLYADFRREQACEAWRECLLGSGLTLVAEEELTDRVVQALAGSHDRKVSLIREIAPRALRRTFSQFAGTKGSVMFRAFENGRAHYVRFVLRKA